MQHETCGKADIGTVHCEGTEKPDALFKVEFVDGFRTLGRFSSLLALLQCHREDGRIGVTSANLADIRHLANLRRMLPDFSAGLVILAAEDNGAGVVDVTPL